MRLALQLQKILESVQGRPQAYKPPQQAPASGEIAEAQSVHGEGDIEGPPVDALTPRPEPESEGVDVQEIVARVRQEAEESLVSAQGKLLQQSKVTRRMLQQEVEAKAALRAEAEESRMRPFGMQTPQFGFSYGFSSDAFYAAKHHKDVAVFTRIAHGNSSLLAREVFALSCTNMSLGTDDLLRAVRAWAAGLMDERFLRTAHTWDRKALASFSILLADQNIVTTDHEDALLLSRLARHLWPQSTSTLWRHMVMVEIETMVELNRLEQADELIKNSGLEKRDPVQAALVRANISQIRGSGNWRSPADNWLEELNRHFAPAGLAPIRVRGQGVDLFDRLQVTTTPVYDGPKVTVIMPTYQGQRHIRTAVQSVLNQSWQNWELIIVDDCSPELDWRQIKKQIPAEARITVLRQESNGGAYLCRRRAMEIMTGDFVTVHDDDDWSHPDKLRVQAQHLHENPAEPGNMSWMVRITEDGVFCRINDNPTFTQKNYSSMMIRREILEEVGGWDDANRGADAEMHNRLTIIYGRRLPGVGDVPLSFMRTRKGSLTHGELRRGYIHPVRRAYTISTAAWHREIQNGASPTLDLSSRQFLQPAAKRPGSRDGLRGTVDVLYVTDLRFSGGNSSLLAAEIRAAGQAGYRVAVAHLPSPVLRTEHPMSRKIMDAMEESGAELTSLSDSFHARLVIIRQPTVLEYVDRLPCAVTAEKVLIIPNNAPMEPGGTEATYNLARCQRHAERLFDVKAIVIPESPQTRDTCVALFPNCRYAPDIWPGFVDLGLFVGSPRKVQGNRLPVIGRHSRDHVHKWPEPDIFLDVYSRPAVYKTRVLGGMDSISGRLPATALAEIEVIPFGAVAPLEFLRGIDFWVYYHNPSWTESFGMAVIEAMASGLVVILPPYFEPLFGEAAIYAEPKNVASIVESMWASPDAYRVQALRARSIVEERFSTEAYQTRLDKLLKA